MLARTGSSNSAPPPIGLLFVVRQLELPPHARLELDDLRQVDRALKDDVHRPPRVGPLHLPQDDRRLLKKRIFEPQNEMARVPGPGRETRSFPGLSAGRGQTWRISPAKLGRFLARPTRKMNCALCRGGLGMWRISQVCRLWNLPPAAVRCKMIRRTRVVRRIA